MYNVLSTTLSVTDPAIGVGGGAAENFAPPGRKFQINLFIQFTKLVNLAVRRPLEIIFAFPSPHAINPKSAPGYYTGELSVSC